MLDNDTLNFYASFTLTMRLKVTAAEMARFKPNKF